jgi:hypothetical protein
MMPHRHAAAHFSDGLDHQYDIQGAALHSHTVSLTAANLATIKSGGAVIRHVVVGGPHA